jgi:hypothetical protein
MSVENQDLIEYKKWEDERSSVKTKIFNNLQISHLLLAVVLLIVLNSMWKSNPDNRNWIIFLAGAIILYFILKNKKVVNKEPVPEPVIKHIAREWLKRKIGHNKDFCDGTQLEITGNCRLRYNISEVAGTSVPFRWDVGFVAIAPNGGRREFVAFFHPLDGYNLGYIDAPTGYTGQEYPDIKYIEKQFTLIDSQDLNQQKF